MPGTVVSALQTLSHLFPYGGDATIIPNGRENGGPEGLVKLLKDTQNQDLNSHF